MSDRQRQFIRSIGQSIAKYRQAVGLTQAQLAEILGVGNDAVSRMERGTTVPSVLRLLELAEIFQCEVADLLTSSSHRQIDQIRHLDSLLSALNETERAELMLLLDKMICWKVGKSAL